MRLALTLLGVGVFWLCQTIGGAYPQPITNIEADLERVEDIHGGAGPWAVAGFRMGRAALRALGFTAQVPHTSQERFELYVVHVMPQFFTNGLLGGYIQLSSIADGLHAATGASIGKANLKICPLEGRPNPTRTDLITFALQNTRSIIVSRKPNQPQRCVELTVTQNFAVNYMNLPFGELVAKGREVMTLPDEAIFTLRELRECPPPPPDECRDVLLPFLNLQRNPT
ncbi:MAG: formylmethanofuran dehydrogenase subunit E family protein [Pseudanabaenaceae cyanobacterium SKYGB_i_bin29]|nr:formylmethanofuran dehydrogenase subunit E family protein [Pseudanabaenaceae cyanobacterium SKYG29]MDW8421825.1 formylmethanofuran dehydrogenase subunit E family protein [Pseudanabaenaceae cyanobacterium SKYGB_i_bin29]